MKCVVCVNSEKRSNKYDCLCSSDKKIRPEKRFFRTDKYKVFF
jgi:hypothetical protein